MSNATDTGTNNPTEQDFAWTAPRLVAIGSVTLVCAMIAILVAASAIGQ